MIAIKWELKQRKLRCGILVYSSVALNRNPVNEIVWTKDDCTVYSRWSICSLSSAGGPQFALSYCTLIYPTICSWVLSRSERLLSYSRNSEHFMEPNGSLPCSQELATSSCPEPDEFSPYPHPSLTSIIILSSHSLLCLPSGIFPSALHNRTLYVCVFCPMRAIFPASLIHFDLNILIIFGEEYVMKLLIMQFSSVPYYFSPFRSKYSPQNYVLKYPQSLFFP
jgi:hypothetical protein